MLINSRRFEKNSCFVFLCNAKLVIALVNIGRVSRYPGTKISWSQQSFLTESTFYIFERSKKSMGLRVVTVCKHTQECHAFQFFSTAKIHSFALWTYFRNLLMENLKFKLLSSWIEKHGCTDWMIMLWFVYAGDQPCGIRWDTLRQA